jgi:hypothetical protein
MIDQVLRDALVSHWDENCNGVDWLAGTPEEYAGEAIRFLAAHPAEPAPVVTDEAVEKLARVRFDREWRPGDWQWEQYPDGVNRWLDDARSDLEAVAPLLGPRPLLDREAVYALLRATRVTVNDEWRPTETSAGQIADAVMELARPMPTREALIWAMCRADRKEPEGKSAAWLRLAEETFGRYADAVLALLSGAES